MLEKMAWNSRNNKGSEEVIETKEEDEVTQVNRWIIKNIIKYFFLKPKTEKLITTCFNFYYKIVFTFKNIWKKWVTFYLGELKYNI